MLREREREREREGKRRELKHSYNIQGVKFVNFMGVVC